MPSSYYDSDEYSDQSYDSQALSSEPPGYPTGDVFELPPNPLYTPSDTELPPFTTEQMEAVNASSKDLTPIHLLRCNLSTEFVSEYTHLLLRGANDDLLSRLEHAWGMRYGTLNVDTPSNVIRLSSDMRKPFEINLWVLIPEERILKLLMDLTERPSPDKPIWNAIDETTYEYTLAASKRIETHTIYRLSSASDDKSSLDPAQLETHTHPFHTLPTITSHVHPLFVICHVGRTLASPGYAWNRDSYWSDAKSNARFNLCMRLFRKWTQEPIVITSPFYRSPAATDDYLPERPGRLDVVSFGETVRQRKAYALHLRQKKERARLQRLTPGLEKEERKRLVSDWVQRLDGQVFVEDEESHSSL
ncbi:hypothetical protein H0H81_004121 [Sphagnurus paluster]|uniref:HNH nuclease domain-containing protein n=1 Tax=Sphagnurus paluster TaxID=117069 RepID=A0A9P7GMS9_9AGAR|nr:hypothetical protein H0H81_004121 [Sphagnurus paluster]